MAEPSSRDRLLSDYLAKRTAATSGAPTPPPTTASHYFEELIAQDQAAERPPKVAPAHKEALRLHRPSALPERQEESAAPPGSGRSVFDRFGVRRAPPARPAAAPPPRSGGRGLGSFAPVPKAELLAGPLRQGTPGRRLRLEEVYTHSGAAADKARAAQRDDLLEGDALVEEKLLDALGDAERPSVIELDVEDEEADAPARERAVPFSNGVATPQPSTPAVPSPLAGTSSQPIPPDAGAGTTAQSRAGGSPPEQAEDDPQVERQVARLLQRAADCRSVGNISYAEYYVQQAVALAPKGRMAGEAVQLLEQIHKDRQRAEGRKDSWQQVRRQWVATRAKDGTPRPQR